MTFINGESIAEGCFGFLHIAQIGPADGAENMGISIAHITLDHQIQNRQGIGIFSLLDQISCRIQPGIAAP